MIVLPADRLPSSPVKRHAMLRDYFCDKDALAEETPSGWALSLVWSDDVARHVDPQLDTGLRWWGSGVLRAGMAFSTRRSGRILSALYDTWTLHSWSEWLQGRDVGPTDSVVILHVDDHRDLGSPRLFRGAGGLWDPLAKAPFRLDEPASVLSAIQSGAVGMGSFMTPFLHAYPSAEVRHLCQPPKAARTADHRIVLIDERDTLLDQTAMRPAIRLLEHPGAIGSGCYRLTPDLADWLAELGPGPILLHIDMDYFNNRYDGDSDWSARPQALDPPLEAVTARIDDLVRALNQAGLGRRIEDIAIAYSPGFFPSELWCAAAERLIPALERLHGP
jgi:hypothetical protein